MPVTRYFAATDSWHKTHASALAGVLVLSGVQNLPDHPALDAERLRLETELRAQFGAMDRPTLRSTFPIAAYDRYYRGFGQTYHVQHQVESVAIKGKSIPRRATLVEAMFMAELKTQILTAGHDLDDVQLPITVDIAGEGDEMVVISGDTRVPPPGDMIMRDGQGIISSVILGPDQRTQLKPHTTSAVFAVYAPSGIDEEEVRAHFAAIEAYVRLVSPDAKIVTADVVTGSG